MINIKIKLYIKYLYLRTKKIKLTKPRIKRLISEAKLYIFEKINEDYRQNNRYLSANIRNIKNTKTETIHIILEALYKYADTKDSVIKLTKNNNNNLYHNWLYNNPLVKEQLYYFISDNHKCPLYVLKEILNYIDSQNKNQENKYGFVFEEIKCNILKNKNTPGYILKNNFNPTINYSISNEIIIANQNCPNEIFFDLFTKSKKELGAKLQSIILLQMMNRGLLAIKASS